MKPEGFRTTNLIWHLLSCLVLYHLIVLFLHDRHVSFWATVFFALHPVNTESVSFIASRNNIMCGFFSFCSVYFYIKGSRNGRHLAFLLSLLSFAGAMMSKEFGVMVLPVLFVYQRLWHEKRGSLYHEMRAFLPFIILLGGYLFLRKMVIQSVITPFGPGDIGSRLFFVPYLIMYNLGLIFLPHSLHQFAVPYPSSLMDWQAVLSILVVVLFAVFLWMGRRHKLILFSASSFVLFLFPVLNIIPTAATPTTVIAMRWLYLPMAFLAIGWAWLIQKALSWGRGVSLLLQCAVLLYFGLHTLTLNLHLWHDHETLISREVYAFQNYQYAGDLAKSLLRRQKYKEADRYFLIAIKASPKKAFNYINYAAFLLEINQPGKALHYLSKAKNLIMTHNDRAQWFNNRGMAHFQLKNYDESIKDFLKATRLCNNEPFFWANLGGAYGEIGDYTSALASLKKGLKLAPHHVRMRVNLAVTHMKMNQYEKALFILEAIPFSKRHGNKAIEALINQVRQKLDGNA